MVFFVYILGCSDGSFYTGHTDNLEKRLAEHASGTFGGYTATRRPVKVLFSQEFPSREEALAAELQIKGWSRKKKMALMAGDWREISRLAQARSLGRPSTGSG
jgi:predicted GIY-YIG superfamily endonuclease